MAARAEPKMREHFVIDENYFEVINQKMKSLDISYLSYLEAQNVLWLAAWSIEPREHIQCEKNESYWGKLAAI